MHKRKEFVSAKVLLCILAVLILAMIGCGRTQAAAPSPAPEVRVAPVIQQDVPVYSEWVATLDGYVNAQIRPQVSGYIINQDYKEGSLVRKGQLLFQIDPRPFKAALDRAKGDLAQAQAQLGKSTLDVERDTPLAEAKAIAKSQLDNEIQAKLGAQAAVESNRAAVEQAELNLEWTKVTSLVDGIAGIAQVQIGNLVGPNSVLTSVSQVDPIKAYFPISEQAYVLAQKESSAVSTSHTVGFFGNSLDLILTDGSVFPQKGLKLLSSSAEEARVDEVVRLVSYDSTIAAQCLRVAGSPLFGMAQSPKSIKGAVMSLGVRRVETILLTCCLGQAFPAKKWVLDPAVFWRHSLGCAMVCRKFSEKFASTDGEKAYMAGLMHDLGFMVNCLVFSREFAPVMEHACQEGIPLDEAEQATMGFTHCDTGRALAEKWKLADDVIEVIAHHHAIEQSEKARPLVALVHLSDLLCRMRGLGYGYYERHKVDLIADPAWAILLQEYRDLEGVDLVRFTFELDEAVEDVHALVSTVFGSTPARP